MRILALLTLLCSLNAFAIDNSSPKANVWVRLMVWPNSVDLTLDNYSNEDARCSGPVYIYNESGRMEIQHFYGDVYARSQTYRRFVNYDYRDRITSAHHSIFCY